VKFFFAHPSRSQTLPRQQTGSRFLGFGVLAPVHTEDEEKIEFSAWVLITQKTKKKASFTHGF
jgi:hypothetical protein